MPGFDTLFTNFSEFPQICKLQYMQIVTIQVLFPRRRRRRTREKGKVRGQPAPRQGTTVPCTPAEQLPQIKEIRIPTYKALI